MEYEYDQPIEVYHNTCLPEENQDGFNMLERMNGGHHAELAKWGFGNLSMKGDEHSLDLGCGGGANLSRLLTMCPDGSATGLDYSQASVDFSKKTNSQAILDGKCEVVRGDVANLPFDDCSFDLVTAFETIYFWPDIPSAFSEALRVLRPGGRFMVCNEADGVNDTAEKWTNIIEEMTVYTPEQVSSFMGDAGFVDIQVFGNAERGWMA
ncbi:MAG: class I SAM-dependent methyltransferase, partial [Coriobacteriales bacterium]